MPDVVCISSVVHCVPVSQFCGPRLCFGRLSDHAASWIFVGYCNHMAWTLSHRDDHDLASSV